jgi:quinol-cytochrome oxidoreductase complex cytochrome b subunit
MADYSKGRSDDELELFFPNEVLRHTLLTFFFISAVMLGVLFFPESFQKSTDEFASIQTRPPWFLLPFCYLSGLLNNKFCYISIISIYAIAFIGIPFLDKNAERSLWKKPIFFSIVIINLLLIIALGIIKFLQ